MDSEFNPLEDNLFAAPREAGPFMKFRFAIGRRLLKLTGLDKEVGQVFADNQELRELVAGYEDQEGILADNLAFFEQNLELGQIAIHSEVNAKIDKVTGLLNMLGLEDAHGQVIGSHRRREPQDAEAGVILFGDLDNFSAINTMLGHGNANLLLRQVGERMKGRLRSTDYLGRFGGDEFIAILPDIRLEDGVVVAKHLLGEVVDTYTIKGIPAKVNMTMGVDVIDHNVDFNTAYEAANRAMIKGKEILKGSVMVVKHPPDEDIIDIR